MAAEIHLEETILSLDIALSEEQVFGIIGIDVRYAEGVTQHLDLTFKPRNHQPTGCLRE